MIDVTHCFHWILIMGAAMLDLKLRIVKVPLTF